MHCTLGNGNSVEWDLPSMFSVQIRCIIHQKRVNSLCLMRLPTTANVYLIIIIHRSYSDVLFSSVKGVDGKHGVVAGHSSKKRQGHLALSFAAHLHPPQPQWQNRNPVLGRPKWNQLSRRADVRNPSTQRARIRCYPRTSAHQNQRASKDALWPLATSSGTPSASLWLARAPATPRTTILPRSSN